MMIKVEHSNIVFRNYVDFGIIYNLKNKSIITVQDVALDIFDFIFNSKEELDIEEISKYISELYEADYEIVNRDVIEFLDSLICENFIIDDSAVHSFNVSDEKSKFTYRDLEGEVISLLQNKNQLFSATIELTYLCNEKCVHCYATYCNDTNHSKELDVDKCKKIIDELKKMNCCHINFTGGDPFMFNGFIEVFKYAREQNFVCCIYTNGQVMSSDPKITDQIIEYLPRTIYISLYGATADIHDSVTQVPGSFNKTLSIARQLISHNISVVFQFMLLKINYNQINEMIDLAEKLEADYRVGLSIINKNNGDTSPQKYAINDIERIKEIMSISKTKFISMDKENAIRKTDLNSLICGAGTTSICISPDGNVYPCVSLKIQLGNIFSESLEEIWNSQKRKEIFECFVWNKTEECSNCKYLDYCPHCPGISYMDSKNALSCNNCDYLLAKASYEIDN